MPASTPVSRRRGVTSMQVRIEDSPASPSARATGYQSAPGRGPQCGSASRARWLAAPAANAVTGSGAASPIRAPANTWVVTSIPVLSARPRLRPVAPRSPRVRRPGTQATERVRPVGARRAGPLHVDLAPALERAPERDLVRVLEVPAHRQPAG